MTGERGQASVEAVLFAFMVVVTVTPIVQALLFWRAEGQAERIANQAAVLVAEGRPIPPGLRAEAKIERDGNRLTVRVPTVVPVLIGGSEAVVSVVVPE